MSDNSKLYEKLHLRTMEALQKKEVEKLEINRKKMEDLTHQMNIAADQGKFELKIPEIKIDDQLKNLIEKEGIAITYLYPDKYYGKEDGSGVILSWGKIQYKS